MSAKEFSLASLETSALMDNFDDDDDAQGRLSFCDLPLSTNLCDWNSSKEVYQNSPSDQDLFEFITAKDLFPDLYARDNIIFCGKLIPYKAPKPDNTIASNPKMSRKSQYHKTNETKKDDRNINESSLASTRVKSSRWYMLAFGLGRFQMGKMELSDIKARQTRRSNSMKKVIASQSHHVHGGGGDQMSIKSDDGKKRGKKGGVLWGLIRLLGCKGLLHNAVTSSAGCIPRM